MSEVQRPIGKTHVAIIIDRSGSMEACRSEAISGVNEQLDKLREANHEVLVTLTVFSTNVDIRYVDKPIQEVENLTEETYVPKGWTSLYDAVGTTIDRMSEIEAGEDDAFLVMINSDGKENTSKEYTAFGLSKKIREKQDKKDWTFTYLGSNQDLAEVAQKTGIFAGNMSSYVASRAGTARAQHVNSTRLGKYLSDRAGGQKQVKDFFGEEGKIAKNV